MNPFPIIPLRRKNPFLTHGINPSASMPLDMSYRFGRDDQTMPAPLPMPIAGPEINAEALRVPANIPPAPSQPFLDQSRDVIANRLATPEVMNRVGSLPPVPPAARVEVPINAGPATTLPTAPVRIGTPTDRAIAATPEPPRSIHKGGFWHRLADVGKGILYGGAVGGLGGAIAGGLQGGFAPQRVHNMQHNLFTRPQWRQERDYAVKQAEEEQQGQIRQAQIENIGTDNQRASEAARREAELHPYAIKRIQGQVAEDEAQAAQRKAELDYFNRTGRKPSSAAEARPRYQLKSDAVSGKTYRINLDTGEKVEIPGIQGAPWGAITPAQEERWRREDERAAKSEQHVDERLTRTEERQVEESFKSARNRAMEADRRIANAKTPEQREQAVADSVSAWEEAAGHAEALKSEYGRDAGMGRGGYPFVNPKKPSRVTTAPPSRVSGPQKGQVMRDSQGRKIKVNRVENGMVVDYDVIP